MEAAQRRLVADLIALWPSSAWRAAGATSAKQWLPAYTDLSRREAMRLERIAGLCAAHPELGEAVVAGQLSLRRVEVLARSVTRERAPHLAPALDALLELNANTTDDDAFETAVRFWAGKADERCAPGRVQPHSLTMAASLFGGGTIFGQLAPAAFANVATAVDAFIQEPDPADAPHRRTLSERRADALDDLASFALTHGDDGDADDDEIDWDELRADDTFDGTHPGEDLDEALAALTEDPEHVDEEIAADIADGLDPLDPLVLLRRRLRRAEKHRRRRIRRRTRARSSVTTNVHIDLRTLAGLRDINDRFSEELRSGAPLARASLRRRVRQGLTPVA